LGWGQAEWRMGGQGLGRGPGSTVSQMDHVGSPLVAWHCCRHPVDFTSPKAINGVVQGKKKRKRRITGLLQPAKIGST
jgi:hypothetical protein